MNNIVLRGVADGTLQDDRTRLVIDIYYNNEIFPWEVRIPPTYAGTFDEYLTEHAEEIYTDLATKLQAWEELNPKERQVPTGIWFGETEETITIPITRKEVVTPTYPDYYVLRANEYPPLAEQMDAFWKGGVSAEAMQQCIVDIKNKYPKP